MNCIPRSDELATGHDAIDACHQALMERVCGIHRAVTNTDFGLAGALLDDLYDLSSIHARAENEVLSV